MTSTSPVRPSSSALNDQLRALAAQADARAFQQTCRRRLRSDLMMLAAILAITALGALGGAMLPAA